MLLFYCSMHERLFIEKKNEWVDWSIKEINYTEGLYEEYINNSDLDVKFIETSCDLCKETHLKPSFFSFIFFLFVYLIGMYMIISYVIRVF